MAQNAKPIDLTRSYLPIDPNTFANNLVSKGEDSPEDMAPIIPHEGYNFMPTAYGYRSYFGLKAALEGDPMLEHDECREIFSFQKADLSNLLIALCDEGIYTRSGDASEPWVQKIALVAPGIGILKEWSYCIIDNVLYVYRQGEANVWTLQAPDYLWKVNTPTTLNMAGQMGIFKAGGRLGFWDSDNAIAYSSFEDKFNVTPSVGTGANITKFTDVIGKIINVKQHGDGFIIYATKSIVGAFKDVTNTFLWKAKVVSNKAGISYRQQIAIAEPDSVHFAWTSLGLMRINNFEQEIAGTEVYDYLKEMQLPIYLKFLEGRYLFIQLSDANYVDGIVTFFTHTVEPNKFSLSKVNELVLALPNRNVTTTFATSLQSEQLFRAYDRYPDHAIVIEDKGSCANPQRRCTGKDYPDYKDYFWIPSDPGANLLPLSGDITAINWNKYPVTVNGRTYYLGSTENPTILGILPNIENKPFDVNILEADFQEEAHDQNFFSKSYAIAKKYEAFIENWKRELETTRFPFKVGATDVNVAVSLAANAIPMSVHNTTFPAWVSATTKNPHTLALNDPTNAQVAFSVYDSFWYDFGREGELFYFLAWTTQNTLYSYSVTNSYSRIKYPVTVKVSNLNAFITMAEIEAAILAVRATAPDPTDYPLLNTVTGEIICETRAQVFNTFDVILEATNYGAASYTLTPTAAPIYKYVNLAGVQGFNDSVNLGLTYDIGQDTVINLTAGVGEYLLYETVGGSGESFRIYMYSALESADKVTLTKTVQVIPDCTVFKYFNYSYPYRYLNYNAAGVASVSPNPVPPKTFAEKMALILADTSCELPAPDGNPGDEEFPRLMGIGMPQTPSVFLADFTFTLDGVTFTFPASELVFTYPGATFLLQRGTAAPFDIVWKGAYVYDTLYKKWGKFKGDYRQLLDFSPINSTAVGIVPHTNFGIRAAILDDLGNIKLFDAAPTDSVIKYGKVGLFRQGFTALEEIRANFRQGCTGQVEFETSLDGRTVEAGMTTTVAYTNVSQIIQGYGQAGKWHNLTFKGQFDLSYLEYRAWQHSRR